MKNRTLVIVVAFVVLVVGGWTLQGARPQQWEYRVMVLDGDKQALLNRLGQQGWELVLADRSVVHEFYLKRPKS
jgi:hypothetical protein